MNHVRKTTEISTKVIVNMPILLPCLDQRKLIIAPVKGNKIKMIAQGRVIIN